MDGSSHGGSSSSSARGCSRRSQSPAGSAEVRSPSPVQARASGCRPGHLCAGCVEYHALRAAVEIDGGGERRVARSPRRSRSPSSARQDSVDGNRSSARSGSPSRTEGGEYPMILREVLQRMTPSLSHLRSVLSQKARKIHPGEEWIVILI